MTPLQQSPQVRQSWSAAAGSEFIELLTSLEAYGQSYRRAISPQFWVACAQVLLQGLAALTERTKI
jgi:hypothetical protein